MDISAQVGMVVKHEAACKLLCAYADHMFASGIDNSKACKAEVGKVYSSMLDAGDINHSVMNKVEEYIDSHNFAPKAPTLASMVYDLVFENDFAKLQECSSEDAKVLRKVVDAKVALDVALQEADVVFRDYSEQQVEKLITKYGKLFDTDFIK